MRENGGKQTNKQSRTHRPSRVDCSTERKKKNVAFINIWVLSASTWLETQIYCSNLSLWEEAFVATESSLYLPHRPIPHSMMPHKTFIILNILVMLFTLNAPLQTASSAVLVVIIYTCVARALSLSTHPSPFSRLIHRIYTEPDCIMVWRCCCCCPFFCVCYARILLCNEICMRI